MPLSRRLHGFRQRIPQGYYLGRTSPGEGDIELLTAVEIVASLGVATLPIVLTTDVSGILPIANGGTAGATAADARTALDVDQAGTDNSTNVTLAGTPNYITIAGQVITRALINLTSHVTGILPIANGGTASATAGDARTALELATVSQAEAEAGTATTTRAWTALRVAQAIAALATGGGAHPIDLTTDVTGDLPVADGGTGSSTAADARTALGVDAAGTDNSTDVTLAGAPNYITIAGQVITRALINLTTHITGLLPVANGGTASATAADARTALGVDAAGTDNSTDVTLAGTPDYITIVGQVITRAAINLTTDVTGDLPVADGGSGSSTAAGARTNFGLGTAAVRNLGTSGANFGLLNANKTDSGDNTFTGDNTFSGDVDVAGFLAIPEASELTIASGVITVTGSNHSVLPQSGSADTLNTINGGTFNGQLLVLAAAANTHTLTISSTAGNIVTAGGSRVLDSWDDTITLMWNGFSWQELSHANNS